MPTRRVGMLAAGAHPHHTAPAAYHALPDTYRAATVQCPPTSIPERCLLLLQRAASQLGMVQAHANCSWCHLHSLPSMCLHRIDWQYSVHSMTNPSMLMDQQAHSVARCLYYHQARMRLAVLAALCCLVSWPNHRSASVHWMHQQVHL